MLNNTKAMRGILLVLLHVTVLQFFIVTASPLQQYPLQQPSNSHAEIVRRFRRKIGNYDGVGPFEYMQKLRDSKVDDRGVPKDIENNPTSTWCFMEQDIVHEIYHPKSENKLCEMKQEFKFSLISLLENHEDMSSLLSKALFRVYLQPIARLLPSANETIDILVNISAKGVGNDSISDDIFITAHNMTISSAMQDHWEEWDLTDGLLEAWNDIENSSFLELHINFKRIQCVPGSKKIPLMIVDPATIPLYQETRRIRHWPLQPFMLFFLDDEEKREELRASMQLEQPENPNVFKLEDEENDKAKRSLVPPCRLKNLTINFADIGMHHIIAPFEYTARQCSGDCSKRSHLKNSVNNHATIVATAHDYFERGTSFRTNPILPKCVSLSYSVLHLVILTRDGSIEEKGFPSMISNSCGCRA